MLLLLLSFFLWYFNICIAWHYAALTFTVWTELLFKGDSSSPPRENPGAGCSGTKTWEIYERRGKRSRRLSWELHNGHNLSLSGCSSNASGACALSTECWNPNQIIKPQLDYQIYYSRQHQSWVSWISCVPIYIWDQYGFPLIPRNAGSGDNRSNHY